MAFQQVAVVGLGLIGTSLALALRRAPNPPRIVGFDVSAENLRRASRIGAIDQGHGTLADLCAGSEAVVLAPPVRAILQLLPQIAPHLAPGTLVTDTGSTKAAIVKMADQSLSPDTAFVGGHPLTGPLTAGGGNPTADLFHGAVYCFTPAPDTPEWALDEAVHLAEAIGAQPYYLAPDEHDALLAAVSHLPHFAAVALVNAVATHSSWDEMSSMAAGGFRAISAVADSDPSVWADIAATNREPIARQIDALIDRLVLIKDLVATGDPGLMAELERAQAVRRDWLAKRGEAAPPTKPRPESHEKERNWLGRILRP